MKSLYSYLGYKAELDSLSQFSVVSHRSDFIVKQKLDLTYQATLAKCKNCSKHFEECLKGDSLTAMFYDGTLAKTLHQDIGSLNFIHLVLETHLYVKLSGQNVFQVSTFRSNQIPKKHLSNHDYRVSKKPGSFLFDSSFDLKRHRIFSHTNYPSNGRVLTRKLLINHQNLEFLANIIQTNRLNAEHFSISYNIDCFRKILKRASTPHVLRALDSVRKLSGPPPCEVLASLKRLQTKVAVYDFYGKLEEYCPLPPKFDTRNPERLLKLDSFKIENKKVQRFLYQLVFDLCPLRQKRLRNFLHLIQITFLDPSPRARLTLGDIQGVMDNDETSSRLVLVLLNFLFIPLIRNAFFVTIFDRKIVYLRKLTWYHLRVQLDSSFLLSHFRSEDESEELSFKKRKIEANSTCVKWIPKKFGFRPIISIPPFKDIKSQLVYQILFDYIMLKSSSAVLDRATGCKRIVKQLKSGKTSSVASFDIQNCFSSMSHRKLWLCLQKLDLSTQYKARLFRNENGAKWVVFPESSSFESQLNWLDKKLSTTEKNRLALSECFKEPTIVVSNHDVNFLIRSYLSQNIVFETRKRTAIYRQIRGVPQGGFLSSLLCCLYFADCDLSIDEKNFKVTRMVDDVLLLFSNSDLDTTYKIVRESYKNIHKFQHFEGAH